MDRVRRLPEVERAIRELADTIRAHAGECGIATAESPASVPSQLRDAVWLVKSSQDAVGQMPPQPPTLRGRMGAWLIHKIRRALFWYTPRILEFQRNVARALEQQVEVIDRLAREKQELALRIVELESAQKSLDARLQQTRRFEDQLVSFRTQLVGMTDEAVRSAEKRISVETVSAHRLAAASMAEAGELRVALRSQETRTGFLLERMRRGMSSVPAGELDAFLREADHRLDDFYLEFENRFRGTREEIKERVRVYLSTLQARGIGTQDMPLLDIGCGRGEWLELLAENGLEARGVDMNRSMVACCREFNLPVLEGDAVEYLRRLKPNTLGGVSGFHIIEHLPFQYLVDLLDETIRVLKPGGVVIFETPNPGSLLVGAGFYLDPTHRKPIPSPLMRFLAEQRGLTDVEIRELHPSPETISLPPGGSPTVQRLNQLLYGARDYAVIGWKMSS